ncbi:TetR/AcrR family transcriptional regulator [Pseudonocardia spinosispora]|uniref:TetR/AcrR family transcriptional regulator n=1 Tax=Pseudonocardia spinosispora TaxID=103441 RepID=UPI000400155A|nr:TetR family transcriptional regulator [Pseudonocardia spinosispora]
MSTDAATFRDTVRSLLRDRLLDAAAAITSSEGWTAVTMSKLADEVGVSRQTVYNEFGSKPRIAEELVMRELGRFLELVRDRIRAQSTVVEAVRAACEGALQTAADNPLVKSILDSAHTGGSDLLPLLTTHSQGLIERATEAVAEGLGSAGLSTGLEPARERMVLDSVVRMVLSHVMQPSGSPAETADGIAWIAAQLVR